MSKTREEILKSTDIDEIWEWIHQRNLDDEEEVWQYVNGLIEEERAERLKEADLDPDGFYDPFPRR